MNHTAVMVACCFVVSLSGSLSRAQSTRSLVHEGNDLYEQDKFTDAEVSYRKALEKDPGLVQGRFNLGNSLYRKGEFDKSVREYQHSALNAQQSETRAGAYYNIGNAYLKEGQFPEAVKAYVESLKLNPYDKEAKYNLSYALRKLKDQQQQQQKGQNKEENKSKNSDQKEQEQREQQKQQQSQQKEQAEPQEQRREQRERQQKEISKADAERILEALRNNELEVQKKLRVRRSVRAKTDRDW